MAKIKILDLCDFYTLDNLGCEDTNKVNGGLAGFTVGRNIALARRLYERKGYSFSKFYEDVGFVGATTGIGASAGAPFGGAGVAIGASLSTLG